MQLLCMPPVEFPEVQKILDKEPRQKADALFVILLFFFLGKKCIIYMYIYMDIILLFSCDK